MNRKRKIIVNILIKIFIALIIITANYSVVNILEKSNLKTASSVGVIGSIDVQTIINISTYYYMINITKYMLSIILGINILKLIIFDIFEIFKNIRYNNRFKINILLRLNLLIIISILIKILIYLLMPQYSIFFNIIIISILLIIGYIRSLKERGL